MIPVWVLTRWILNKKAGELLKQTMFYGLTRFYGMHWKPLVELVDVIQKVDADGMNGNISRFARPILKLGVEVEK
ncbi:MAG: hypothetical protein OXE55_00295 [Flavobacteriaceae bacterium]|nr:hypothetical protein [Flavobacteriaceae bacterium]